MHLTLFFLLTNTINLHDQYPQKCIKVSIQDYKDCSYFQTYESIEQLRKLYCGKEFQNDQNRS